jgi:hypothetical protein
MLAFGGIIGLFMMVHLLFFLIQYRAWRQRIMSTP